MLTRGDGLAVVVQHRRGCPSSRRLRLALTLHRVPFVTCRAGTATDEAAVAGGPRAQVSLTVLVGERWLVDPSWQQVVAAATGR